LPLGSSSLASSASRVGKRSPPVHSLQQEVEMKKLPKVVASIRALVASVIVVGTGAPLLTQSQPGAQAPPVRTRVQTVQVKPEMVGAWMELHRTEVIPALKKAGVPWRWAFSNGGPVGPGFTYTIVTPVANFAQFDAGPALRRGMTPEAYTRYLEKERTMLVGTSASVQTLVQNASIVSGSSTPPPIAVVTTIQLLPGRGQEFASITAADFVPAMKKGGATDYWVFATNFGGPIAERTIVQPLSKWADLDSPNPLVRAIGQEGAQKLNQKRVPLIASSVTTVLSYVADLSFGAPPPPTR
jgi:hypothetical protein